MKRFVSAVMLVSISFLYGCSSEDEKDLEPSKPQLQINVMHGDIVAEGSRVLVTVENTTAPVTFEVEEAYILQANDDSLEFVAPTVDTDTKFTIKVNQDNQQVGLKEITIQALEVPKFAELPRSYPLESSRIARFSGLEWDEAGVPLFEYGGEQVYFPIHISKVAQVYYAYVLNQQLPPAETEQFIAMASWLKDNCVYTSYGFCSWQTTFDVPAYKLPDNWPSAMAQGQAISVLLSAYAVTGDHSYIDVMSDAIAAFNYPIEEKGVVADFDGHRFYEEYGSIEMPAHVLNGFLFALAGLYDAWDLTGSEAAKQAFDQGVDSLEQVIDKYDMGFTSYYDYSPLNQIASTKGNLYGDGYHELHISQLAWLYKVSGKDFALEYMKRFLAYDTGGFHSFNDIAESSKKITEVQVSSSVSASTHGPDYLIDSNWTWRRYWSANKTPTSVVLSLNNGSGSGSPLEINQIRLTALKRTSLPGTLDLYACSGDARSLLHQDIMTIEPSTEYLYDINGYESYTVVIDVDLEAIECNELELVMTPNSETGLIAFREINIHLEQPTVLDYLLSRYDYLSE